MKKIIVGAFALAMAAVANAGYVNWSVSGVKTSDGASNASGYLAYFLVDSGSGFLGSTFAQASVAAALEGNDLSFLNNAVFGDNGGAAVVDGGYAEDYNVGWGDTELFVDDSTDVKSYLVIFNSSKIESATQAYVTGLTPTEIPYGEGLVEFNAAGTATPGAWVDIAPEPTSGLLLLIGVAGLALRHRRA